MKTAQTLTLPASPEELQRLLADPSAAAPEPLRTALRRSAVVQTFDRALFDAVLGAGLAAAGKPLDELFEQLVRHPFVQTLPGLLQVWSAADLPGRGRRQVSDAQQAPDPFQEGRAETAAILGPQPGIDPTLPSVETGRQRYQLAESMRPLIFAAAWIGPGARQRRAL